MGNKNVEKVSIYVKKSKYLKIWTMYKIWKYFEKGQVIEIKHIFPLDKINSSKMPCFSFHKLQLFTVLLLICDSHMSWNARFVSKTMCGIFHFRFCFVFIKVYIFVQQNAWLLWLKNAIIPFKIKIVEEPHTVLLTDLWFLNCK